MNLSVSEAQLQSLGIYEKRQGVKESLQNDEFLKGLVTTFVITVNNGLADVVKGENMSTYLLRGDGFIYEKLLFADKQERVEEAEDVHLLEANFRISPFSFFQTNTL